jgi:hypothetical protein
MSERVVHQCKRILKYIMKNVSVAIMDYNFFGRYSVGISTITPPILTEFYHGFPQSLQENAGIVARSIHYRFLPNHFQFIIQFMACNKIVKAKCTFKRQVRQISILKYLLR